MLTRVIVWFIKSCCCVWLFAGRALAKASTGAGCTLIALLGQENRFEALDFCYHIVKVYGVDSRDEVVGGVVSELRCD